MPTYLVEQDRTYQEHWIYTYQVVATSEEEARRKILEGDIRPITKHSVQYNLKTSGINNIFRIEE